MVVLAFVLLLIGTLLIGIELFIPGFGVCGIVGVILFVVSAIVTVTTVPYGVVILAAEIVVFSAVIAIALNYIRKRQLFSRIILDETLNVEAQELGGLDYFLGKEGSAKTSLRPFGTVDFNGVPVEVYSDGPYIPENTRVKVTQVLKNKIVVKRIDNN